MMCEQVNRVSDGCRVACVHRRVSRKKGFPVSSSRRMASFTSGATLLTFDGSTLTVDLDLDEPVDILKWQIFSLTEVPVEEQRLWCNMKQGLLFDDDDLKKVMGSGAGVVLILLPSPVGPGGTAAAPLPEEEWRYCCTRVCAGADAKVMQVRSEGWMDGWV